MQWRLRQGKKDLAQFLNSAVIVLIQLLEIWFLTDLLKAYFHNTIQLYFRLQIKKGRNNFESSTNDSSLQ